jgi:hypothetical protein
MTWLNRRAEIEAIREAFGTEMPSCINCVHFSDSVYYGGNGLEQCNLDPLKRRPPAAVIAKGCPSFEEDIPF